MEDSSNQRDTNSRWKPGQTYILAAVCLVVGLAIGYFLRGSASQPVTAAASEAAAQPNQAASANPHQAAMPSLNDMKRMADKQAEPLLAKLKTDPRNVDLLNKTALTYKAAHQFNDAIAYFQKALEVDPKNVPIRTDMASCMYYVGDVDGALSQLDKSLSYDPKHPGTLMNIGIIRWQGKNDVAGAVAAWEKLLKLNPNFSHKADIERMINEAKQGQQTASASN